MKFPVPLLFQVPNDALDDVLRDASADLVPDFLCFETFYQAVAATWPHSMNVLDVGGFVGMQGWLFRDFVSYICVDDYDLTPEKDGIPVPRRCALPKNGNHVTCGGIEYMRPFIEHLAAKATNIEDKMLAEFISTYDLFLCTAAPNTAIRNLVASMPNSIVWYPGQEMRANGPHAEETIAEFARLRDDGWDKLLDAVVRAAVDNGYLS